MGLNYDTELEMIFSPQVFDDSVCKNLLDKVGIPKNAKGNMMMLFTQAATVAALKHVNEETKDLLRQSGVGMVLHGWSKEGRASFLIQALHDITTKYSGNEKALRYATFDLHKYVFDGLQARLTPNPFEAPVSEQTPFHKFEAYEMLMAMSSKEQINKPLSPDQLYRGNPTPPNNPAPNRGGIFGRRVSN
jgi:hypothetical protein